MSEVTHLSRVINEVCKPDKLNIGALGNIVSQLHIHVIARFKDDIAWPHGVWHPNVLLTPYEPHKLNEVVLFWQKKMKLE